MDPSVGGSGADASGRTRNLRLVLAYDGTAFAGWQRQPGRRTVQAVVEDALGRLLGHDVRVVAAGRTDAGVHARAQVVNFRTSRPFPVPRLVPALRGLLPPDVVPLVADEVPLDFHARYNAARKTYLYHLWNAPLPEPLHRHWRWHVPVPLDVEAMMRAGRRLVGRHDFAAFRASASPVRNTCRTMFRCEVEAHGPLLRFRLEADGFLMHMARGIVGTLVEIGRGRWPPERVDALLATGDRKLAGPTAPACGLILWQVDYPDHNPCLPGWLDMGQGSL